MCTPGIKQNIFLLFIFILSFGGFILAAEYDLKNSPSRRLHEEPLSCSRPYAVSVYSDNTSNTYYCRNVSNYSGTDCIEQSWFFYTTKDEAQPSLESYRKHDHRDVLWGSAVVEISRVDNRIGKPCSESEKQ